MCSWAKCCQPLNSNIVSRVKPLQITLQLGLLTAVDNVEYCLLFTTWTCASSCKHLLFAAWCGLASASLEAVYQFPVTLWQVVSWLTDRAVIHWGRIYHQLTLIHLSTNWWCLRDKCLTRGLCDRIQLHGEWNTWLCSGHTSCWAVFFFYFYYYH